MSEKLLLKLVDPATGQVKKFRTFFERVKGEVLPLLGWHAVQGLKVFALWAVGGIPGIAAGAGAALIAARRYHKSMAQDHAFKDEAPEAQAFNLAHPYSRLMLDGELAPHHAGFGEACAEMAKVAGLKEPPRVLVFSPEPDTPYAALAYALGCMGNTGRKGSAIFLGRDLANMLPAEELRARVAEQFARIRLDHSGAVAATAARRQFNLVSGLGLAVVAFIADKGPMPLLGGMDSMSVIASIGLIGTVAGRGMMGLKARALQAATDRGAVLITGDAYAMMHGLQRVRAIHGVRSVFNTAQAATPLGRVAIATGLLQPPFEASLTALARFGADNPAFCQAQQNRLAAAFAAAAADGPVNDNPPANPAISPKKLRR